MSHRLVNGMIAPPWIYWVIWRVSNWLLWLVTGLRVEGRQRVPKSGALLVVANHLNNADPYLLSAAVPRQICYMAKIEPEFEPGAFGTFGYYVDLDGMKSGLYSGDYYIWYCPAPFKRGDEKKYLNVLDNPLKKTVK